MELNFLDLKYNDNIIALDCDDYDKNVHWNEIHGKWFPYNGKDVDKNVVEEIKNAATKLYAIMPYILNGVIYGNCIYEGWKFVDYRNFVSFTTENSLLPHSPMFSHSVSELYLKEDADYKNFRMFTTKEEAIDALNSWMEKNKDNFLRKLTDISDLKQGNKFHVVESGEVKTYEFLCVHPHNEKYILAIDSISQNAPKLYIPTLLNSEVYVGQYNNEFFDSLKIKYLEKEIDNLKKRKL